MARLDLLCINGEGGELPDLIGKYPRNRGQQIASGRFGVSALLANSSDYLEIKIGQGAKPGEGGHLPAKKRSEEHTSELQSQSNLVCRLLLEKKQHQRLRIADRVFVEQQSGIRMRRSARYAYAARAGSHRMDRTPSDRGPLLPVLVDPVAGNL